MSVLDIALSTIARRRTLATRIYTDNPHDPIVGAAMVQELRHLRRVETDFWAYFAAVKIKDSNDDIGGEDE